MKPLMLNFVGGCAMLLTLGGPLRAAPPATPVAATPAGRIDADAEVARLQETRKAAVEALAAERTRWSAALSEWYKAGLEKFLADRSAAGDLDGVLAGKGEHSRFTAQTEPTAEEIRAMPLALRTLRETYSASYRKTSDELARRTTVADQKLVAELEVLQKRITMTGNIEEALKVKRARESLVVPPATPPLATAPAEPAPPSEAPPAASGRGREYLADIVPAHEENPVVLTRGSRITTRAQFKPPVEITFVGKVEDTNLRMVYAADQIIFNWEKIRTEFRIDGGPGSRQHKPGKGEIPKDTFVTVRWRVTPGKQSIFVDDELRFEHEGDYSGIDKPVAIFAPSSRVTVQSLKVEQLPAGTK